MDDYICHRCGHEFDKSKANTAPNREVKMTGIVFGVIGFLFGTLALLAAIILAMFGWEELREGIVKYAVVGVFVLVNAILFLCKSIKSSEEAVVCPACGKQRTCPVDSDLGRATRQGYSADPSEPASLLAIGKYVAKLFLVSISIVLGLGLVVAIALTIA